MKEAWSRVPWAGSTKEGAWLDREGARPNREGTATGTATGTGLFWRIVDR